MSIIFLYAHPDEDEVLVFCDDENTEIFTGYVSNEDGGRQWVVAKALVKPLNELKENNVLSLLDVIELQRSLFADDEDDEDDEDNSYIIVDNFEDNHGSIS